MTNTNAPVKFTPLSVPKRRPVPPVKPKYSTQTAPDRRSEWDALRDLKLTEGDEG